MTSYFAPIALSFARHRHPARGSMKNIERFGEIRVLEHEADGPPSPWQSRVGGETAFNEEPRGKPRGSALVAPALPTPTPAPLTGCHVFTTSVALRTDNSL